jgi:hypothetical protein
MKLQDLESKTVLAKAEVRFDPDKPLRVGISRARPTEPEYENRTPP